VLATGDVVAAADAALTVEGDGFSITASHGTALLPGEAASAADAPKLADERMYRHKARRSPAARRAELSRHAVIARLGAGLEPEVVSAFGAPAAERRAA
jgi:GGDEF domain-containing protein